VSRAIGDIDVAKAIANEDGEFRRFAIAFTVYSESTASYVEPVVTPEATYPQRDVVCFEPQACVDRHEPNPHIEQRENDGTAGARRPC
jgi:hypothetical protein